MYDIIKDIWKNPGAAFSPMPVWVWNGETDAEKLTVQLDEYHKKGIDACLIRPCMGEGGVKYLSDGYFDVLERVLEEAKKRFMLIAVCDCAQGESAMKFSRRRLCAKRSDEPLGDGDEVLFCVYVSLEGGMMTGFRLDETDGYIGYDLVLCKDGSDDGLGLDVLDSASVEAFIASTHERYIKRLAPYFGQTLIGFYSGDTPRLGLNEGEGVAWNLGMIEEFFECGGELEHLTALFFETKEKKIRREAEYIYSRALNLRLGRAFYAPVSDWCKKHGVALMGHPCGNIDTAHLRYFTIPGRRMTAEAALSKEDSAAVKSASDAARSMGLARNLCEIFGGCGEDVQLTPDDMMARLNHAFAHGCNMILPHAFYCSPENIPQGQSDVGARSILWQDYRKLAGYIKRMSWLGAIGTNNPSAAVLCSDAYIPIKPVEPLYEKGYSFNYLSLTDFMERAHVHDGTVRIDRYTYDAVLVDGRLRLDSDIVCKIGKFAVEGGHMYRGSDFLSFMEKHAHRHAYFEDECGGKLRFLHYTKSGCPFFLLINEGNDRIIGSLVTDIAAKAEKFDPFTGKTAPCAAVLHDVGFAYPVSLGAHESLVIGMNPDSLPTLGEQHPKKLCEVVSLDKGRMKFDFTPEVGRHAILSLIRLDGVADVTVNGNSAGRLLFKPYELDITDCLHIGENEVKLLLNGCEGFDGCTVRIYDNPEADGSASGENDELWDIYDGERRLTGKTHRRGDPLAAGEYHLVVHIWVRNAAGEYLLTKRAPDKMFPLTWECTGGSALAGEDSLTAALREVREETGLKLTPENGRVAIHAKRDDYFGDVWLFEEEFDLSLVRLQPGETVDRRTATADEIRALIGTGEFAPYDYLEELFAVK